MPTYEYKCSKCGHEFELFQLITDEPVKTCPQCGGNVERLIGSGAGVIFKGSGFYATDYRSESYNKAANADKPPDKPKEKVTPSSTKTKSDKKP